MSIPKYLPDVMIEVIGDTFSCVGADPLSWKIYAEVTGPGEESARTQITIAGRMIADITIHVTHRDLLVNEVQEVSAAILWSALRSIAHKFEE